MKQLITMLIFLTYAFLTLAGGQNSSEMRTDQDSKESSCVVNENRFNSELTDNIKNIKVSRSIKVEASDADNSFVMVSGSFEDVQKIKTEIKNDTLEIFQEGNTADAVKISVGLVSSLYGIEVCRAAKLNIYHASKNKDVSVSVSESSKVSGKISSDEKIQLNLSRSSTFEGELFSNNVNISSSRSSEARVRGSASVNSVFCKNASSIDLREFNDTSTGQKKVNKDVSSEIKFMAKY